MQVVTELVLDARPAEAGSASYIRATRAAQAAADKLNESQERIRQAQQRDIAIYSSNAVAIEKVRNEFGLTAQQQIALTKASGGSIEAIVSMTAHLKLAAAAAYALSPAFRAFVNPAISLGVTGITMALGTLGPAAASAGVAVLSRLGPAITLMGRIGLPILAATTAFQALNSVVHQGSDLLDKYANSQRQIDRSDLAANLSSLTKQQGDTISAEQVKYATELGNRLQDATFNINQFFKVQLDLTDPALKLQAAWVAVAETIGLAAVKLNGFIALVPNLPGGAAAGGIIGRAVLNAVPGGGLANGIMSGVNYLSGPTPAAPTQDESREAAMGRLGAAMGVANIGKEGAPLGNSFAARFGDANYQLANSAATKAAAAAATEYKDALDRAIDTANKHIAVMMADAAAVGQGVGPHEQLRTVAKLTEAAIQAGINPAGEYAKTIKEIGERAGAAATSLAELKAKSDLSFDRDQIGRTGTEQKVASQLRAIYGDNFSAQMDSTIANQIRFNEMLRTTKDITTDLATGFSRDLVSGLRAGEKGWDAFAKAGLGALERLADKLIDMAMQNLVAKAFGGATSFFGVGGSGSALGGTGPQAFMGAAGSNPWMPGASWGAVAANGHVFNSGNVTAFAKGGVVNQPTMAPMALFGEAGPEAIMPLRRGSDGKLGIAGSGGGGGVAIDMTDNRTIHIGQGASMETVAQLRATLDQDRRDRKAQVISIVKTAQKTRQL